jgi:hypothetical protein
MCRKRLQISLLFVTVCVLTASGPAFGENTMVLGLCQELVNMASSYQARAEQHAQVAKGIMAQIEVQAKQATSEVNSSVMDGLFQQYDQHRALENKLRALYKATASKADECMQSVE